MLEQSAMTRADYDGNLLQLADVVRSALEADRVVIAQWHPSTGDWSAHAAPGGIVGASELSNVASSSVLDLVRDDGEPMLAMGSADMPLGSASIVAQQLESILAVPLFFWDVRAESPERTIGGVLYAHRSGQSQPFDDPDVVILEDLAAIAQPTINLARALRSLEQDLAVSRAELGALRAQVRRSWSLGALTTADPRFGREVLEPLGRVKVATRVNVLVLGPTGAGKTRLAEAFHYESARKTGPFVVLDCAQVASVETLSAELFGFAPNSGYANAPKGGRPGKALLADNGTLFIDEVATLPLELQHKLLRLIERGEFTPLGEGRSRTVDLQVIAATNEDLLGLVETGRFREDLYWRLCEVVVSLPALDERPADIPGLADVFVEAAAKRLGRSLTLSDDARRALTAHPWSQSGNIRGLERTIVRSCLMGAADITELSADDLRFPDTRSVPTRRPVGGVAPPASAPPRARKSDPELDRVVAAILDHGYATEAAAALGLTYRQLIWRLQKHGLSVRDVLARR